MSTKRVALYIRVSADRGQTVDNQLQDLHHAAERFGWTIAAVHRDEGISGAKGRDRRPGLDAPLGGIARLEYEIVAAWSVCRLGRSLSDLIAFLGELKATGLICTCISRVSIPARHPVECCFKCLVSFPNSKARSFATESLPANSVPERPASGLAVQRSPITVFSGFAMSWRKAGEFEAQPALPASARRRCCGSSGRWTATPDLPQSLPRLEAQGCPFGHRS
jgi:hypothetical protein